MKPVVVVGGGVTGLVAALLTARKGHRVSLVESATECGGLLGSFRGADGYDYDYGTHLLRDTGIGALDQLLFSRLDAETWQRLPYLKSGAYFAGKYSEDSASPNATFLPRAVYQRGLAEIMGHSPNGKEHHTAQDYLVHRFGETFTRHIFEPALNKFCGADLEHLAVTAPLLFGLRRIIVSTPEASRELKRSPYFDEILAFHHSHEGLSGLSNYYPVQGGIGQWAKALQCRLESQGVSVLTGTRVQAVLRDSRRITAIELSNGQRLDVDHLVWTISPSALLQLASLTFRSVAVTLRKTCLYYYAVDRPFRSSSYFFVCYDGTLRSFRTTLYSNLRTDPVERAHYSCCVEVLCGRQDDEPDATEILREQIAMGVVDEGARWTLVGKKTIPHGFPVMTPELVRMASAVDGFVADCLDNVLLLGKASGGVFLMNDVLRHAYDLIEERL